jgi:hypothetical protein
MNKPDEDELLLKRLREAEVRGYNKALDDLEWTASFLLHGKPESDVDKEYNRAMFALVEQMHQMRRTK